MDGLVFANPAWARDRFLIRAESAEFELRLLPLLGGRAVEFPSLVLHQPELGLQMEADGRRHLGAGRETSDPRNVPWIGSLVMDRGTLHYVAAEQGADIRAAFEMRSAEAALPFHFQARGRWKGQAMAATGRTGSVLALQALLNQPFPVQVNVTAGSTSLHATGTVASLVSADGLDAAFELRGASLADLYRLVGVVLPETPRYAVRGRLTRKGDTWSVARVRGSPGRSDLSGRPEL